jgi:AAA+ ATPase superfamily predicted ATPase
MERYFPQGVASDSTFCNRDKERFALKNSIEMHEHIVLVAPRRYGKTSLVTQVLKENSFPGRCLDFFFVLSHAEVIQIIMEGIARIINTLLPSTKSACQKIIESIAVMNPKLTFNFLGQKLEITTKQTTEKSISELLLALDQFAEKSKKSCA